MVNSNESKPNFYAIIPANVRYDEDLVPNAKLLYGEITALCNEKGYCWASNSYFAKLYKVSAITVSKWVSQLAKNGYITTQLNYKEGTKEIVNRYIRIVNDPIKEKVNTSQRKGYDPIKEKVKDNITVNTTINNTSNKVHSPAVAEPVPVTNKKNKPVRHKYGEFENVLLADIELEKIKSRFPDWQRRIDDLSFYMGSKGITYKDHYKTILNWARKDEQRNGRAQFSNLSEQAPIIRDVEEFPF